MGFPERLARARRERHLTQGKLAEMIREQGGKARGAEVSRWEKGDVAPRHNNLKALATIFGPQVVEWILEEDSPEEAAAS